MYSTHIPIFADALKNITKQLLQLFFHVNYKLPHNASTSICTAVLVAVKLKLVHHCKPSPNKGPKC